MSHDIKGISVRVYKNSLSREVYSGTREECVRDVDKIIELVSGKLVGSDPSKLSSNN